MSILLIGLEDELGPALLERLLEEGDVVGVIEEDAARAARWRELGAHVASGQPTDFDLVERAAQHARSIVVLDFRLANALEVIDAVLSGVRLVPGEAARIIVVASSSDPAVGEALTNSEFDFVILRSARGRSWIRSGSKIKSESIAEAVNAADDLAGSPHLDLDLSAPASWAMLGVAAPT